jgi:hypothetical protein
MSGEGGKKEDEDLSKRRKKGEQGWQGDIGF